MTNKHFVEAEDDELKLNTPLKEETGKMKIWLREQQIIH